MIHPVHIVDLHIAVGEPIEVGETAMGLRRLIPILGGEATGPRLRGRILAGGADFQLVRPDHTAELHARYVIEVSDGARIYVENNGLRHGPAEAMERLRCGEPVDPALIYFRTVPKFETADTTWHWLTRHIFVAAGVRHPHRVELAIYQI
jgi:Protein of unknown function (DUF3237)